MHVLQFGMNTLNSGNTGPGWFSTKCRTWMKRSSIYKSACVWVCVCFHTCWRVCVCVFVCVSTWENESLHVLAVESGTLSNWLLFMWPADAWLPYRLSRNHLVVAATAAAHMWAAAHGRLCRGRAATASLWSNAHTHINTDTCIRKRPACIAYIDRTMSTRPSPTQRHNRLLDTPPPPSLV